MNFLNGQLNLFNKGDSVELSLIKTARHENFPSILGRLIPVAQHHSF